MAGFCLTAKCPSCYSSVVVDTVFAAGTLKIYFGTTLGRPDSPATALLHSQPYPVRINIEGRAPQKSSNPSFDRFFLSMASTGCRRVSHRAPARRDLVRQARETR